MDEESGGSGEATPSGSTPIGNGQPSSKPVPITKKPRESLEADETIFAVGDEEGDADKWSDDDSPRNSGERKRLTAKDA